MKGTGCAMPPSHSLRPLIVTLGDRNGRLQEARIT